MALSIPVTWPRQQTSTCGLVAFEGILSGGGSADHAAKIALLGPDSPTGELAEQSSVRRRSGR